MNTRQRHERNNAIIAAYNGGATVEALSQRFKISRPVIYLVLQDGREQGVITRDRDRRGRTRNTEARNTEIVALYESGLNMQEIGDKFGISRERVRQVLRTNGVQARNRRDTCAIAYEQWHATHAAEMNAAFDRLRSISKVCKLYPQHPVSWIQRTLDHRSNEIIHSPVASKVWSDEEILDCLRLAPTYHGILTSTEYARWRETAPKVKGRTPPTHGLIAGRFGSWRTAVERAGLRAGRPRRGAYRRRWTADDARQAIRTYLDVERAAGKRPTYVGYTAWAVSNPQYPSGPYLRQLTRKSWAENMIDIYSGADA